MTRLGAIAALAAVTVAACAGSSGDRGDTDVLEVFGPWRGVDADRFSDVLAAFEDGTGLDVRYVGSVDFVSDLLDRAGEVDDPPDVAMVPQPALIRLLAADGNIVPLAPDVGATVAENYGPAGDLLGVVDGVRYAVPFRATVKSLVWYRPDVFEEQGWVAPSTLDELAALVDRIDADTEIAPWCLGLGAGSATGWVATDWTEDLVLRLLGPDTYQQWASGEIEFADPAIADAFARFRSLALEPGRAVGGVSEIIETPVDEAILPLLDDPPACAMHRQGDFAESWLPAGTTIGADGDIDVFVLPGATDDPPPLVVGGTQAVQFENNSDSDALMAYLAGPDAAAIWARQGGFISLNRLVPDDAYPVGHLRELIDSVGEASAIVFDASDQMPSAIGTSLLWDGITAWVAGGDDYPTFAAAIDDALATDP